MIGSKIGHALDKPFAPLVRKIPFSPNAITISGFMFTIICSPILAHDLRWGALCLIPAVLFDMADGMVARVQGKLSDYGAFLDSVLDRYSDAAILLAIAWNLGRQGSMTGVVLSGCSLAGALIISYVRARAEGLGIECTQGLMERPERLILLFAGAVSGYMIEALWVLSVLTHVTVVQRILHTRKQILR